MNAPASLILPDQPLAAPNPTPQSSPPLFKEATPLSASQKRAANPLFRLTWALNPLSSRLPFPFPVDPTLPPSPKVRYRSGYAHLGPEPLFDEDRRKAMSDFEIALHLIDFSPLERELARSYQPTHKGQKPFHPVSMFLAVCLRIETGQSWAKVATLLAGEQGAGWRRLFGFEEGETPSVSGLRYFQRKADPALFEDLGFRWAELLQAATLFPEHSSYPGDPPAQGVSLSQDGMLHQARSRPSCPLATDQCYRPLLAEAVGEVEPSLQEPPVAQAEGASSTGRPCRARQQGREGCCCDTPACQQQCQRASTLDPEARFIHYQGHNGKQVEAPDGLVGGGSGKAKDVFGYRSIAERVLDDRWCVGWIVASDLYPANTDERTVFVERIEHLTARLPQLKIGEVLADSGLGYRPCLEATWKLGALRMIDIRQDPGDKEFEVCLHRGYDANGRPLCAHGYPMRANGYDHERRRAKYVCAQLCTRQPLHDKEPVAPPEGCPYLGSDHPLGQVINLGRAFPDRSMRLAREIPYGSEAWKARFGRRNQSESRNSQLEGLGLKRMRSYGLGRNEKDIQLVDFLINLHTLGRLVREATGLNRN